MLVDVDLWTDARELELIEITCFMAIFRVFSDFNAPTRRVTQLIKIMRLGFARQDLEAPSHSHWSVNLICPWRGKEVVGVRSSLFGHDAVFPKNVHLAGGVCYI